VVTTARLNLVKALFCDAEQQVAEPPLFDPPYGEDREGFKPGCWPGAPYDKMPPTCYVVPLGYEGDTYYFVDTCRQLRAVERFDKDALFSLFGLTPNLPHWAWPRWSKPTKGKPSRINGLEQNQMVQCLVRAAQDCGAYDPVNSVRGRGAWIDDTGALVWHSGDRLWCYQDGVMKRSSPGEIGRHFYVVGHRTFHPWRAPVPVEECPAQYIFQTLRSWRWGRPIIDPVFALGLLGCGLMSGALQHRPHGFVTGDRGTGKTTLQDFFRGAWGAAGIALEDATEAGIAQLSRHDVLPISFDELEARADNRRGESIINLARIAYSGATRLRGSGEHDAKLFRIRSCFLFSAINPPPMSAADRSRMVMLNLHRITEDGRRPGPLANRDDAVGRMLVRRMMEGWPDFLRGIDGWREILREVGLTSRMQDTYGALLSAAEVLVGPETLEAAGLPVTENVTLGQMIADHTESERMAQLDNWSECLVHMFRAQIEYWKAGERPTIGATVGELKTALGDKVEEVRAKLAAAGLGLTPINKKLGGVALGRHLLAIPVSARGRSALARLFDGTEWSSSGWSGALRQAPADVVIPTRGAENMVRIDRYPTRCFLVDLDAFEKSLMEGGADPAV
jgi:hypothetical protein